MIKEKVVTHPYDTHINVHKYSGDGHFVIWYLQYVSSVSEPTKNKKRHFVFQALNRI